MPPPEHSDTTIDVPASSDYSLRAQGKAPREVAGNASARDENIADNGYIAQSRTQLEEVDRIKTSHPLENQQMQTGAEPTSSLEEGEQTSSQRSGLTFHPEATGVGLSEPDPEESVKGEVDEPAPDISNLSIQDAQAASTENEPHGPALLPNALPSGDDHTHTLTPLIGPATPDAEVPKESGITLQHDDDEPRSEIQSILDQFDEKEPGANEQEAITSPSRLIPNIATYPQRKSSLEPLGPGSPLHNTGFVDTASTGSSSYFPEPEFGPKLSKSTSINSLNYSHTARLGSSEPTGPTSPTSHLSLQKSLPPVPDPEPDLPFDFHRFLEQLRHRTADPVAKFLRSFLIEFGKKQWMVHEQVKIISDFLTFITGKMAQCEVWRDVSDAEFDNAKEGMEKLVMNRLYSQTFSPAIPPPVQIPAAKGKRKTVEKALGPGRRGQHQEDIERDEVLAQKVRIYGWVREEHLDIHPVGDSGRRFLALAQQELLKIKTYRAPRDKVICVLNCCKVIFGLLRNSKLADTSADSFVPLLILVVLHANPEHLVSNVQYILRFRNQDKLGGEAGYYLSSLMGAIQFIENLDRTALTISDADFEKHVEAAVSAIAEKNKQEELMIQSRPEPTPRSSTEVDEKILSLRKPPEGMDGTDEKAAVSGLLRTIQRPLSSIGRIFSEDSSSSSTAGQSSGSLRAQELSVHPPETPRRLSPAVFQPPRSSSELRSSGEDFRTPRTPRFSAEDAAARQASAEAAEAHRIQRAEHNNVVETLASMFPDLDRDIIDDVVREKEGRVGLAVEACLALSS